MKSDFPLNINTVFIQKDREICHTEVSHTARATLRSKISNLIQDSIGLIKTCTRVCECGYAGAGWRRVVFLNMTDTDQNCPGEWQIRSSPRRTCQRSINKGCSLAAFSTGEANYSEVCGKLIGYQFGSTDALYGPMHESSVGLSSTTNPSLGVAIPVPAQTHLYTHAKGMDAFLI